MIFPTLPQTDTTNRAILIALVLLSSCGFAYKPTAPGTNKRKDIYSIPFERHHLNMTAGVAARGKDTAAFNVFLWTDEKASEPAVTINSLKVSLTGYDQHVYVLQDVSPDNLRYRFMGLDKKALHHRLNITVTASITEAGKTIELHRSVDFKRYFWLDIAGN